MYAQCYCRKARQKMTSKDQTVAGSEEATEETGGAGGVGVAGGEGGVAAAGEGEGGTLEPPAHSSSSSIRGRRQPVGATAAPPLLTARGTARARGPSEPLAGQAAASRECQPPLLPATALTGVTSLAHNESGA